jgi:PAS domain S-box-containing protein
MVDLDGVGDAELLKRAMESSIDGMAVLGEDGEYLYVNRAHAELYGYDDPGELVGRTWRCLYDEERIERFEREVLPTFRERGRWRGEAVGRRRDGSSFPQELSLTRTPEGGIVCVVRDITERNERLETLERYETVLGTIRDAVYTLGPTGEITWVNETAVEEFDVGYTREELVGAPITKVLDDEDIRKCVEIIRDLLSGERDSGRCEIDVRTASGGRIPCDLHLTLLPLEDGAFRGTVGVVRDVTERKRREQRLSVLNRVLRHNLRNEMTVVSGAATVLEEELDGTAARRAGMIRESAERMADLGDEARRVQSLLGRDGHDPSPVEVVDVVEACCAGLRATHPDATVDVDASGELWALAGDGLDAVVENLVENAIEYHPGAPEVVVSVEPTGPDHVTIRVVDDGPGIPESEVEVLEADVETALRHGTGLGLWVVTWLVDAYDGEFSFDESPSGGTAVTVRLRRAEGPAAGG